ncbi:MAG TPA: tetraacyldisaccharide 4'-kinase, partial [Hyphomicrobiaceae bacterium]|nr:tetraacyldisaccharide 4'-kinase [Hyphomicrobiaceae bacterium]
MPVDEPSWWYAQQSDWRACLLHPIAVTYGALVVRRFTHARPYRTPLPVICVGNFTVGGTGKTPLALLIVRALKGR